MGKRSPSKLLPKKQVIIDEIMRLEQQLGISVRPPEFRDGALKRDLDTYRQILEEQYNSTLSFQYQLDQRRQRLKAGDAFKKVNQAVIDEFERRQAAMHRQQRLNEEQKQKILTEQTKETDSHLSKLDAQQKAVKNLRNQLFAMSQVRTKIGANGQIVEDVPFVPSINQGRSTTAIGAGAMGISRRLKTGEFSTSELKQFRYKLR